MLTFKHNVLHDFYIDSKSIPLHTHTQHSYIGTYVYSYRHRYTIEYIHIHNWKIGHINNCIVYKIIDIYTTHEHCVCVCVYLNACMRLFLMTIGAIQDSHRILILFDKFILL